MNMKPVRLDDVAQLINDAKHLVALTGAGISKESNVPTFRGPDGLWRNYDVTKLATPQAFAENPSLVWEWYSWRQDLISKCKPNPAHLTLAKWEQDGLLKSIITQNVDGLHRIAGSKRVFEIHGNIWITKCTDCGFKTELSEPATHIPICPDCNGLMRPDVVWFGESLDILTMRYVEDELTTTDVMLVIGTSAVVQPAASFPLIAKDYGATVIEVNIEPTPITQILDYHILGKAGEVLPTLDTFIDHQDPD